MGQNYNYKVNFSATSDKSSFEAVKQNFTTINNEIGKAQDVLNKYLNNIEKFPHLHGEVGKQASQKIKSYQDQIEQYADQFKKLTAAWSSSKDFKTGDFNIGTFVDQLKVANLSISDIVSSLNAVGEKSKTANTSKIMMQEINANTKGLKSLYETGEKFQKVTQNISSEGAKAFRGFTTELLTSNRAFSETVTIFDKMAETMGNTVKWGISSSIMNAFAGAVGKAIGYVQNLDQSLNDIRIVTGKSADEMERFSDIANKIAQETGSTTLDATKASLIYYQQGLSDAQVTEMTDITLKMSNVLGTSASEVSDYMTAIWNNFYDGSKSLEYYADVLTKLGAATASSAEEISTGLEKFAAIADTVGLSYEYATAALTTVTATTRQSAEVVGTAFKTLFARIQDLELGKTLDDGTTLGKYSEALEKVGIRIKDASGELRDMDEILAEMGDKWDVLTKAQQVSLAQTVAGTRQYTQLVALMDNWDVFAENLEYASGAAGSLEEQQSIYMESTEAHLNKMSAAWEDVYDSILNEEVINKFADIMTKTGNILATIVDGFGGGGNTLLFLAGGLTKFFGPQLAKSIADVAQKFDIARQNAKSLQAELELVNDLKELDLPDNLTNTLVKWKKEILQYSDVVSEAEHNEMNNIITTRALIEEKNEELKKSLQLLAQYQAGQDFVNADDIQYDNIMRSDSQIEDVISFFSTQTLTPTESDLSSLINDINISLKEFRKEYFGLASEIKRDPLVVSLDTENFEKEKSLLYDFNLSDLAMPLEGLDDELDQILTNLEVKKASLQMAFQLDMESATDEQKIALQEQVKEYITLYSQAQEKMLSQAKQLQSTTGKMLGGYGQELLEANSNLTQAKDAIVKSAEIKANINGFLNLAGAVGQVASAFSALSNIVNIVNNENLSAGEKLGQLTTAITVFGMAIASAWGSLKKFIGAEALATIQTAVLSGSISGLTGVLQVAKVAWQKFWAAATGPIGILIMLIGVLIGLIVGFIKIVKHLFENTPENRLKRELEDTKKAAQEANEAFQELKGTIDSYTDTVERIKDMKEGTLEFYEAVVKANEEAQKLIDTWKLSPDHYFVDKNGMTMIDADVLSENAKREKQKNEMAQGYVPLVKGRLSGYYREDVIEDFVKEVNKLAQKNDSSAIINRDQGEKILERALKENTELFELDYRNREAAAKIQPPNGVTQNQQLLNEINKNVINVNQSTQANTIEITEAIRTHLSDYNKYTKEMRSYEDAASANFLRGDLKGGELTEYENLSQKGQEAVNRIISQARNEYNPDYAEKDEFDNQAFLGMNPWQLAENGKWYNPMAWSAKIANWISGDKVGDKKAQYAKEVLGYTQTSQGRWLTPNNTPIDEDELFDSIKIEDAYNAIESGSAYTDDDYKALIQPTLKKANDIVAQYQLSEKSASKIQEALLGLQAGTVDEEFFNTLTNDERSALYNQSRGRITNAQGQVQGYTWAGIEMDSDYDLRTVNSWLQPLQTPGGRSPERIREDLKEYNNTLAEQAEQLGTTKQALDFYAQAMYNAQGVVNQQDQEAASTAAERYKLNKAFNETVKVYEDNEEAIKDYQEAMKNGEEISYDVADAMGAVAESLSEMGLSLNADTITDNLNLVNKLLKGTEAEAKAAYEELSKLAKIDVFKNTFGDENVTNQIAKYGYSYEQLVEQINSTPFGTTLNASYADVLGKMIEDTKMTVSEVNRLAEQLEVDIPVSYTAPDALTVTKNNFTTAAQAVQHWYSGDMIVPDGQGGYNQVPVNYGWVETIEDKTDEFLTVDKTKITVNHKNNTFSPKKTKPSTTKKGGSGKKKELKESNKDRYHDVNIELEKLANELDKLDKLQEGLLGQDYINNLTKQYELLNKEIDKTNEKLGIAKDEQKELRQALSGIGAQFNADGTIANYSSLYDKELARVNDAIKKHNAGKISDAALEAAEKRWEKFLKNLERYDELITDFIPDLEMDVLEKQLEQFELKMDGFTYSIEMRLDLKEAEQDWNEFIKDLNYRDNEIMGEVVLNRNNLDSLFKEDGSGIIQSLTNQINNTIAEIEEIETTGSSDIYGTNKEQAMEDLETYAKEMREALLELQDIQDNLHQSYIDMMDETQEKLDEQIEAYETITNLIEHEKELISLTYGEDSYEELSALYDKQLENNKQQLDALRQQTAFWHSQMLTLEEGSDEWEAAKEKWLAAVQAEKEAILSSIQELQDWYLNKIDKMFDNINKNVTGGLGLDYASKEWDLINKNADQYLDNVNAIYSIQQLQNKYLDAIEKTDNLGTQKKLNDLMKQELATLREQDKLSQYDIDRANLKYEIALKQMALEEAQQNKNTMRLRRDSQGNYTYQYVADEDEISSVQEELANLYNELYNMDYDKYRENLAEITEIWTEAQEQMREAAQINDPDERAKQEKLIQEQYGQLINNLVEQNETLKSNMYQSTMSQLFDLYDQNAENYDLMTEEQKLILDNFLTEETNLEGAAFDNLFDLYNENIEQFKNMTDAQQEELMGSLLPQWDTAYQQMADTIRGEGGFFEVYKTTFEDMKTLANEYLEMLLQITQSENYEEIKNSNEELFTNLEEFVGKTDEILEAYDAQLAKIAEVIAEVEDLILKYKEAEESALAAAEAGQGVIEEEKKEDSTLDVDLDDNQDDTSDPDDGTDESDKSKASNGAPFKDTYTVQRGDTLSGIGSQYGINYKRIYVENRDVIGSNPNLIKPGMKLKIPAYQSGGYTGDWAGTSGQLAMLHKKELVLNASDTKNLLGAMDILRSITDNLGASLFNTISAISAHGASPAWANAGGDALQQDVHITAEFPNVTNSHEIEDALNNLVNHASQYIQK